MIDPRRAKAISTILEKKIYAPYQTAFISSYLEIPSIVDESFFCKYTTWIKFQRGGMGTKDGPIIGSLLLRKRKGEMEQHTIHKI